MDKNLLVNPPGLNGDQREPVSNVRPCKDDPTSWFYNGMLVRIDTMSGLLTFSAQSFLFLPYQNNRIKWRSDRLLLGLMITTFFQDNAAANGGTLWLALSEDGFLRLPTSTGDDGGQSNVVAGTFLGCAAQTVANGFPPAVKNIAYNFGTAPKFINTNQPIGVYGNMSLATGAVAYSVSLYTVPAAKSQRYRQ